VGPATAHVEPAEHHEVRVAISLLVLLIDLGCRSPEPSGQVEQVRLGFFPNITHAPALVGLEHGALARAIQPVRLEARAFMAGPQVIEALFAGAIDVCYVGPMPALGGYLRSQGEALRIVAGMASGGASFVVRRASHIERVADLHGKRIASPQLGNTQDLALRIFLRDHGLRTEDRGGDVLVMPIANADILSLMRTGRLDGAWVPEPWVTRLLHEADGRIFIDERDLWPDGRFPSAVLVVSESLRRRAPELVAKLVAAHVAETEWTAAHPNEAQKLVAQALMRYAKTSLPPPILAEAWGRLAFSPALEAGALLRMATEGRQLGYLPESGDPKGAIAKPTSLP
jgi:NitT/TauT family transport system substrate-binding protein